MDYETLEQVIEANGAVIHVDEYLSTLITWGGEGRFNVYREVMPNQYDSVDTFYVGIQETMNVRWAKRQALQYMQNIQEELLA